MTKTLRPVLIKRKSRKRIWTEVELDILERAYPDVSVYLIARFLNLPSHTVHRKAAELGLNKSESFDSRRFIRGESKGEQFHFPKGHTPWNKGKKGVCIGGTQTQFKTGDKPINTKPLGTITIRKDKRGVPYKFIKVADKVWPYLQVKIWEDHYGKVPKGMVIRFKDGNQMNCEISNLEMITKADNMRRNSIQNYPVEIKETIRAIHKINRLIKDGQEKS